NPLIKPTLTFFISVLNRYESTPPLDRNPSDKYVQPHHRVHASAPRHCACSLMRKTEAGTPTLSPFRHPPPPLPDGTDSPQLELLGRALDVQRAQEAAAVANQWGQTPLEPQS